MPPLIRIGAISALLMLPCVWQSRIQAGDLSSHVYNAWLALQAEQGRAPGLVIASQWTNILADLVLLSLMKLAGAAVAQRILLAAAVLVFVWGAFVLARVVSGSRPWFLLPCLAVLAYGWVFHAGFINFYLSMGLCLWALAALWHGSGIGLEPSVKPPRDTELLLLRLAAVPLLGLALIAHALPVAWALAAAGYAWLARRTGRPTAMAATGLIAIAALRIFLTARFPSYSSPRQILCTTGADQAWVYGPRYLLVSAGVLLLWVILFDRLARQKGLRRILRSIPFQLVALTAAGVALVPVAVHLPPYRHALWFITDRMSLAVAVLVCALLAAAKPAKAIPTALAALAGIYFCFVYLDARRLNRLENELETLLDALPAGQRVVNTLTSRNTRIDPLAHMLDRACVGRCYSYANYEPSTWQFRLRAVAQNPIVVSEYEDTYQLQTGTYVVRQRDLPLYRIGLCGAGDLCIGALHRGDTTVLSELR